MAGNYKIKENLRKLRKEAHLSQEEMAEKMGIQRSTYRNIENGTTRLISDNLAKLAEALNVSEERLLGYDMEEIAAERLSDREKTLESDNARLVAENDRLRGEVKALRSEKTRLEEHQKWLEDIVSWMKSQMNKA